eukprot:2392757-Amphidinium_carterae.2
MNLDFPTVTTPQFVTQTPKTETTPTVGSKEPVASGTPVIAETGSFMTMVPMTPIGLPFITKKWSKRKGSIDILQLYIPSSRLPRTLQKRCILTALTDELQTSAKQNTS